MDHVPSALLASFELRLGVVNIPESARSHYLKWLRFYFDYCDKYQVVPVVEESFAPFLAKLQDKQVSVWQQKQATHAVSLYYKLLRANEALTPHDPLSPVSANPPVGKIMISAYYASQGVTVTGHLNVVFAPEESSSKSGSPVVLSASKPGTPRGASWKAEFASLECEIRLRHYSRKTLHTWRRLMIWS